MKTLRYALLLAFVLALLLASAPQPAQAAPVICKQWGHSSIGLVCVRVVNPCPIGRCR